jgi:hypothetical protein
MSLKNNMEVIQVLKLKKRSVVVLTDQDIKLVSGGLINEPREDNQTLTTSWTCPTSAGCDGSNGCSPTDSGGCGSVWCDSHYCNSADCNSGACASVYCDSNNCVSLNCQSHGCDSGGCQSYDCNSNGCQSIGDCASDGRCTAEATGF